MMPIEAQTFEFGKIHISEDVLAGIASAAAMEAPGCASLGVAGAADFAERIGRKAPGRGVKITVDGNTVKVDLSMSVKFGYKIHDTAKEVQQKVESQIKTMTGLNVSEISIAVVGVLPEKKGRAQ